MSRVSVSPVVWTAWFLRTRVAQAEALRPEDWQHYDASLFLEITSGLQANPFAGGGPPPRGGQGPRPGGAQRARPDGGGAADDVRPDPSERRGAP